jgi:hypothetical protein
VSDLNLRHIEKRIAAIERDLSDLIEALVGPAVRANPKGRLPQEIRSGIFRRQAAWARAQKRVGKGRGYVGTSKIKRKLQRGVKKS